MHLSMGGKAHLHLGILVVSSPWWPGALLLWGELSSPLFFSVCIFASFLFCICLVGLYVFLPFTFCDCTFLSCAVFLFCVICFVFVSFAAFVPVGQSTQSILVLHCWTTGLTRFRASISLSTSCAHVSRASFHRATSRALSLRLREVSLSPQAI